MGVVIVIVVVTGVKKSQLLAFWLWLEFDNLEISNDTCGGGGLYNEE